MKSISVCNICCLLLLLSSDINGEQLSFTPVEASYTLSQQLPFIITVVCTSNSSTTSNIIWEVPTQADHVVSRQSPNILRINISQLPIGELTFECLARSPVNNSTMERKPLFLNITDYKNSIERIGRSKNNLDFLTTNEIIRTTYEISYLTGLPENSSIITHPFIEAAILLLDKSICIVDTLSSEYLSDTIFPTLSAIFKLDHIYLPVSEFPNWPSSCETATPTPSSSSNGDGVIVKLSSPLFTSLLRILENISIKILNTQISDNFAFISENLLYKIETLNISNNNSFSLPRDIPAESSFTDKLIIPSILSNSLPTSDQIRIVIINVSPPVITLTSEISTNLIRIVLPHQSSINSSLIELELAFQSQDQLLGNSKFASLNTQTSTWLYHADIVVETNAKNSTFKLKIPPTLLNNYLTVLTSSDSTTELSTLDQILRAIALFLNFLSIFLVIMSIILFIIGGKTVFAVEINILYFNYGIALLLALIAILLFAVYPEALETEIEILCYLTSFTKSFALSIPVNWSLCISILILYVTWFAGNSKRRKIYYYLIIFGWGFTLFQWILNVIIHKFVLNSLCGSSESTDTLNVVVKMLFLIPVYIVLVINLIILILAMYKVRKAYSTKRRLSTIANVESGERILRRKSLTETSLPNNNNNNNSSNNNSSSSSNHNNKNINNNNNKNNSKNNNNIKNNRKNSNTNNNNNNDVKTNNNNNNNSNNNNLNYRMVISASILFSILAFPWITSIIFHALLYTVGTDTINYLFIIITVPIGLIYFCVVTIPNPELRDSFRKMCFKKT